jgi:DNA-directed RNA polymerase subunit RPC12/RpoP
LKTGYEARMEKRKQARLNMQQASIKRPAAPSVPRATVPERVRQELHCHNCERYVQFVIDLSLDGKHVLKCPNCGHEHYRIVRNGRITADRWGQDPSQGISPIFYIGQTTCTSTAIYDSFAWDDTGTSTSSDGLYYNVWAV